MHKSIQWIISAVTAGGLLLTGTAMASPNPGPAPAHATLTADTALGPPSPMPANLSGCPALSEGDHGGCVSLLQTELNVVNHARLPVIGTFGRFTKHAVINFQWKYRILPANGVAGPHTKAVLSAGYNAFARRLREALLEAAARKAALHTPGSTAELHNPRQTGSVEVCGLLTCSWYLTKAETRQLNTDIELSVAVGTINLGIACAALGTLTTGYLGAACLAAAIYGPFLIQAVKRAAGESGCLRVLSAPPSWPGQPLPDAVALAFSADRSRYCHNT